MKKPSTLLLILAIVALVLLLPKSWVAGLFGLAWWLIKLVIIVIALLIIILYVTKKN